MRITRAEVALKVTDGGEKQFLFCTDVSEPDCSKLKTTRWKTGHTEVIHTDTLGMIVSSHTIAEFTHEALRLSRPLKPGQPLSTVALLSPLPPPPYTHTNAHTKKGGGGQKPTPAVMSPSKVNQRETQQKGCSWFTQGQRVWQYITLSLPWQQHSLNNTLQQVSSKMWQLTIC